MEFAEESCEFAALGDYSVGLYSTNVPDDENSTAHQIVRLGKIDRKYVSINFERIRSHVLIIIHASRGAV